LLDYGGHDVIVETTGSSVVDRFSLVQGGPVYRLQSLFGLAMPDARHVAIRAFLAAVITALPLVLLAGFQGQALSGVKIPYLSDIVVNVRMLFSLPLLVFAEVFIDPKIKHAVKHFVTSGLVTPQKLPAFEDVVSRTMALRDAAWPTILMLAISFAPLLWSKDGEIFETAVSDWRHLGSGAGSGLSLAGWWFAVVSLPIYRFWLSRCIWLLIVWAYFLARVSKLDLAWVPTHPDRVAGLGFLAPTNVVFGWIGLASETSVTAKFANMIAFEGQTVSGLKYLMIASLVLTVGILSAPLLVFSYRLYKIKHRGLFEYGTLVTRYVQRFDDKWNRTQLPSSEPLLGTADIQSLADVSAAVVSEMKPMLLDKETLFCLAIPAVVPMLILVIVETPTQELLTSVLKLMA
jgi:hypothetical protein